MNCQSTIELPGGAHRRKPVAAALAVVFCTAVSVLHAEPGPDAGRAGFVVSHIEYALANDAAGTDACPQGMTQGYRDKGDVYLHQPLPPRGGRQGAAVQARQPHGATTSDDQVTTLCMHPELGNPDPRFHTIQGNGLPVYGIDLDGVDSSSSDPAIETTCPHDDFRGFDGENGIDNQFYRVVGCSASFQSTGQSNTFSIEMLTGSWGILITLDGVDDLANDDHVSVGFFANADPIQLSAEREPLSHASYEIHRDPRFHARTTGRIENGLLTTAPTDLNFEYVVNTIRLERPLKRAIAHLKLTQTGELEGYLAGYMKVEDAYDIKYGFRNGRGSDGELAPYPLRQGSSAGQALVLGHTCEGAYFALYEHADADPDPETGRCTSISVQYRIRALPAFVFDAQESATRPLPPRPGQRAVALR